jgi:tetraacyldisaccharide 4'-kinase
MEGDHIKICYWLKPLSWLYGLVINLRNILFDSGVLPSESFDVPVICVGNITAGGTGKTPHTEYLIRLLSEQHQVAVLSRGYKRKSKGYILATPDTPMQDIGDEPFQMKQKYPQIHMAVDANRRRGIKNLCRPGIEPATDVVLLDDAFQHRYVVPGINILLMDYHRLVNFDELLPAGRLREPKSSCQRADIVIVTKCPPYITPMEEHGIARSIEMQPWQKLFFTRFKYGKLKKVSLFPEEIALEDISDTRYNIVLLTGIASPQQMEYDLQQYFKFTSVHFSDHHDFQRKDIEQVERTIKSVTTPDKQTIVITTEKDAARLLSIGQVYEDFTLFSFRISLYVLPIEVEFMDEQEERFNQFILSYVQKNSRNSTLLKGTNANKP